MRKKFAVMMLLIVATMLLISTPVFATSTGVGTTGGSMKDWATSYSLQGTTDVYYSAPWLVKGVQFFIAWVCIIAFLAYYMSYLCSIVVLSNKELFYTIDALKKDQEQGDQSNEKGLLGGILQKLRSGGKDGLNGGADNIAVFFLMLSLNFKAYSVYKSIDENSEGGGGGGKGGPKYAYSDTMASFFLKSLFDSVMVTFILSIALSGLLIRMWFTVGDVLIVKAERFAQTNLVAMLDSAMGSGRYSFTISNLGTPASRVAEDLAQHLFANIIAWSPEMSAAEAQAIGVVVEDYVTKMLLGGVMDGTEGSFRANGVPDDPNFANSASSGYLATYIQNGLASTGKLNFSHLAKYPAAQEGFRITDRKINNNPSVQSNSLTVDLEALLAEASLASALPMHAKYAHYTFGYAVQTNYATDQGDSDLWLGTGEQ